MAAGCSCSEWSCSTAAARCAKVSAGQSVAAERVPMRAGEGQKPSRDEPTSRDIERRPRVP